MRADRELEKWLNSIEMEEGKELLKEWGLPEELVGVASMALGNADWEQPVPKPRKEGYVVMM